MRGTHDGHDDVRSTHADADSNITTTVRAENCC
jgi:hypothetical protein